MRRQRGRSIARTGGSVARRAVGLMLLGVLSTLASAQQLLTAQQIIEKALVVLGGVQHLAAIQTATAEGKVELLGGFPGKYQFWAKAPNKLKTAWDIRYIQQERAFDGI